MKYSKWIDKNITSLEGKIIIVTGANSGIGFQLTKALAYKNATVVMACRNLKKAMEAKQKIMKEIPKSNLIIEEYDQADFSSIESFANRIIEKHQRIDALVCNAGVYFPKANYKTKDGYELTVGTNYLGTYKLINSLKEKLKRDNCRVILVSSLVSIYAKKVSLKEAEKLTRNKLYNYSKGCIARFGYELANKENNLSIRIVHPGICSTNIISSEQTGFPTWFGVLGHKCLTLFTHSSQKACLSLLFAISDEDKEKHYITPRGIFAISGFPKKKSYPKFMKTSIIEETEKYLKETIYVTNN